MTIRVSDCVVLRGYCVKTWQLNQPAAKKFPVFIEPEDSLLQSLCRPFSEPVGCPFFEVSLSPLTLRLLNQYFEYVCQYSYSWYMYHPIFLGSVIVTVLNHKYKLWWNMLLRTCPSSFHFLLVRPYVFPSNMTAWTPHMSSYLVQIFHGYLEERKISLCQIASSPTPSPNWESSWYFCLWKKNCVMWPCALRTSGIHTKNQMTWASCVYAEFFIINLNARHPDVFLIILTYDI
jgi:hypothetical protein